jgi:hypothetical protein
MINKMFEKNNLIKASILAIPFYLLAIFFSQSSIHEKNIIVEFDPYEQANVPYKSTAISKAKNERFSLRFCVANEQIRSESKAVPTSAMMSASNISVYCDISLWGQVFLSIPYFLLSFIILLISIGIKGTFFNEKTGK